MLYLFIQFLLIFAVDISFTFSDSLFNSFSTSTRFVLFKSNFLLKVFVLLSKSVFCTKSAVSALVANLAPLNLAAKLYDVSLLNS